MANKCLHFAPIQWEKNNNDKKNKMARKDRFHLFKKIPLSGRLLLGLSKLPNVLLRLLCSWESFQRCCLDLDFGKNNGNLYYKLQPCFLIMGDFNYLHINWESLTVRTGVTSDSHSFIDTIQDALLMQNVTSPTMYRFGQHPSTLDLIFPINPNAINKITHLQG